jgi:ADP-L-glycero-D-manno-heptose 6-epimerase
MIAITGAGGFIGSVILGYFNKLGIDDVYLFDDLPQGDQFKNLIGKKYRSLHSIEEHILDPKEFDCVIHFGANSSTLERDWSKIYQSNVVSTRRWHDLCEENNIKFIFASSAAVYGNGSGPLNHYAFSKMQSENEIRNGVILRLFNVYGPNEYHKGRMASTIYHWHNQPQIRLFKGSENFYRDFIYVEDVAKVVYHFYNNYQTGIYDLGTGNSVSFSKLADLVSAITGADKEEIVMPDDLSAQYQTYTGADLTYLKNSGFDISSFTLIESGVEKYFQYLNLKSYY